jgi:hypothetical protein
LTSWSARRGAAFVAIVDPRFPTLVSTQTSWNLVVASCSVVGRVSPVQNVELNRFAVGSIPVDIEAGPHVS